VVLHEQLSTSSLSWNWELWGETQRWRSKQAKAKGGSFTAEIEKSRSKKTISDSVKHLENHRNFDLLSFVMKRSKIDQSPDPTTTLRARKRAKQSQVCVHFSNLLNFFFSEFDFSRSNSISSPNFFRSKSRKKQMMILCCTNSQNSKHSNQETPNSHYDHFNPIVFLPI